MQLLGHGVNYYAFSIPIWLLAGALVLWVDARRCRAAGQKKEARFASFVGWLDIALGVGFLIREWIA